jgi:hypothetical protein
VNKRIVIYGCEDRYEVQIKRKIIFNKRSRCPMIYDLSSFLPNPDNPVIDNPIPPSVFCLIPPENLATTKSPVEGELLIRREIYCWHGAR